MFKHKDYDIKRDLLINEFKWLGKNSALINLFSIDDNYFNNILNVAFKYGYINEIEKRMLFEKRFNRNIDNSEQNYKKNEIYKSMMNGYWINRRKEYVDLFSIDDIYFNKIIRYCKNANILDEWMILDICDLRKMKIKNKRKKLFY